MLPARNRMRRSTEFDATVRHGTRTAQPDLVVHVRRCADAGEGSAPRVGLIIAKSVGSAVDRHRVARRLRHVARPMLADFRPCDRVVIRALPGSRTASSARLEQQLRRALRRTLDAAGAGR
ncbi:ribonuclease P protein component [Mycobacterium sp. Marseille-P9652]|uniref:ribonuclease P protein component n=1 Tax=Mycobacterium sp. Marseille-P9652 TaxID=2654950 RepID=UPI0012E7A367|nr:ribonuclease P protein component [Mycobacterium sp. Marseille-P9652]